MSGGHQSCVVGEDMGRPQEVHPVVAARIVSHTTDTDTDTKRTNYLGSAQTKYTWHDGRYARAHMDRGGADSCAFGRGGAESTTFDDQQPIPNGVIHVSYNLYACETTKARLYIMITCVQHSFGILPPRVMFQNLSLFLRTGGSGDESTWIYHQIAPELLI